MDAPIKPENVRSRSLFRRDPSRRIHFIHHADMGTADQRFAYLQKFILDEGLRQLDDSSLVLGCLLAFDGLCTDSDLRGAYAACANAIRWQDAVRIDWLDEPRINARNLSSLTAMAIKRVQTLDSFEQAQAKLLLQLGNTPLQQAASDHSQSLWDLLLRDGLSWCQATLPPVLFGHVSQATSMSALPRTALAREMSRLALSPEIAESSNEAEATDTVYAQAFEAALLGRPTALLTGGQFIRKLIEALRPPATGSKAARRSAVLDQLKLLSAQIDQADEVSALLYLFALSLVENGTRRKSELAPTTPYDYIQSFAQDFHAAASGTRLTDMDPEAYAQIFTGLLNSGRSLQSYRLVGLKAFHQFLRAWWNVPRLPSDVFKIEIDAPVAANMVWPHEIVRIGRWLSGMEATRFIRQLHCTFLIASNAMVRIRELQVLRLMNVIDEEEYLTIEIAREIRDGREKTSEGRRRVFIRDPRAVEQIRTWLAQRLQEQARPSDYLFGDPSDPSRLADAGKMYYWLNRLLKCATGDDSISLHSVRHSIASSRLASILESDDEHEINPLDILANEAGHVGGHVTAVNYCHLFESGLRRALDAGLIHLLHDYDAVSAWSGIASATLRQRVRRAKTDSNRASTLAGALKEAAGKLLLPDASAGCALDEPVNPLKLLRFKALSYAQVLGILSDVAQGLSISQASLRQDMREELVIQAIEQVGEFADRHGSPGLKLSDFLTLGAKSLRDASGELLGLRPDFPRTSHHRWSLLARAIQRCETNVLTGAAQYWLRTLTGTHLAVRSGADWDQFITLLSQAEINTSLLALKFVRSAAHDSSVETAVALAQATIRLHFGRSAREFAQAYRAGRPPIWLVIGSDAALLDKDGSANSIAGLHCCMLAAHVWLSLLPLTTKKHYA